MLPFDIECARIFGTIKSKLRNIGKPTGEVDALIAATAMAREGTLVTSNKRHFENIEGLKIEVWPIAQEVADLRSNGLNKGLTSPNYTGDELKDVNAKNRDLTPSL